MVRSLAVGTILAIAIPALHAQDTTRVAPGDAVRVDAPARGWKAWDGWFVAVRADSVVLRGATAPDSVHVVPIADVRHFLVNHGNRPARSMALIGFVGGAAIGFAYGASNAILYPCSSAVWICDPWHTIGAFTLFGAALGGITGAFTHAPPWRAVKLAPQPSLTPLRTGDLGIGMHLDLSL